MAGGDRIRPPAPNRVRWRSVGERVGPTHTHHVFTAMAFQLTPTTAVPRTPRSPPTTPRRWGRWPWGRRRWVPLGPPRLPRGPGPRLRVHRSGAGGAPQSGIRAGKSRFVWNSSVFVVFLGFQLSQK